MENPFNEKNSLFRLKRQSVLCSGKNPAPFIKHIDTINKMGVGVLFQVTLNDYENENLELNLPPLQQRITSLIQLSDLIGKEKVLWRYDPLILTNKITVDSLINKISSIGEVIYPCVGRLTISFLSPYRKVLRNLNGLSVRDISVQDKNTIALGIRRCSQNWNLPVYSCAEPLDLSMYGINHGSCIDPALIVRCYGDDISIQNYFRISKTTDLVSGEEVVRFGSVKDRGQRKGV
jgi:hypothetical protein